jgi:hypothetical protein
MDAAGRVVVKEASAEESARIADDARVLRVEHDAKTFGSSILRDAAVT